MAIEHIGSIKTVPGLGVFGSLKENNRHGQVSAGASTGSTYHCFRVPSNTKLHGNVSRWKSSGAKWLPTDYTIDLGIFGVDGNITDDDDALDSVTIASGAGDASFDRTIVGDVLNFQKEIWKFVNGQTKVTLKTDVTVSGIFSINLTYLIF